MNAYIPIPQESIQGQQACKTFDDALKLAANATLVTGKMYVVVKPLGRTCVGAIDSVAFEESESKLKIHTPDESIKGA